jgi:hypothetical protein
MLICVTIIFCTRHSYGHAGQLSYPSSLSAFTKAILRFHLLVRRSSIFLKEGCRKTKDFFSIFRFLVLRETYARSLQNLLNSWFSIFASKVSRLWIIFPALQHAILIIEIWHLSQSQCFRTGFDKGAPPWCSRRIKEWSSAFPGRALEANSFLDALIQRLVNTRSSSCLLYGCPRCLLSRTGRLLKFCGFHRNQYYLVALRLRTIVAVLCPELTWRVV